MNFEEAVNHISRTARNIALKGGPVIGADFAVSVLVNLGIDYEETIQYMLDRGKMMQSRMQKES